ncbi:MAG: hypothetical protein IKF98_00440 [Clostridia bacterium]|nr:hypothetical protein [Oscillospiraceae bacterium]MBR3272360.1 hypothetical protein [Clostridia bacterium]
MFDVNLETMEIKMHRGDTGSFKIHAERESGTAWTEDDRALFTIKNAQGEIMLQRFYRLDDQWSLGDGVILVEFHNDDTDTWETGQYTTEFRFDVDPVWDGTAPGGRCVNALTAGVRMIEGPIVRTAIQSSLTIDGVLGDI